jgi:hypothetical protein
VGLNHQPSSMRLYKRRVDNVRHGEVVSPGHIADVLDNMGLGQTDLIGGVYEGTWKLHSTLVFKKPPIKNNHTSGGFKTWECSIDLANYLAGMDPELIKEKNVLEVCVCPAFSCRAHGLILC